jgi:hypothetical protein
MLAGLTVVVAGACAFAILRAMPQQHDRAVANDICPRPGHPHRYIGVITAGAPGGAQLARFIRATGVRPSVVPYYIPFGTPWNPAPVCRILRAGALPVIQINPRSVSLASIAAGRQDAYLAKYAQHVHEFGLPVAISFGHEMNGFWYSWGYRHTAPATFVAAWRKIVTVFRQQGADNVTWLWTVNVIDAKRAILPPARWWPGNSYVTWVGIDGYYLKPSWKFASLFGPTIKAVRELTLAPILITETAAVPHAGKPAKIADLFAGVRAYGLLGFVWFDVNKNHRDWRLSDPAATAAYRHGAQAHQGPAL